MKIIISFLAGLFLLTLAAAADNLYAQNREMTVILLRHAEKDVSAAADKTDPDLAPAGNRRAVRLIEMVKKYKPEQIFSTNFKRTRLTVTPLAEQLNDRYRLPVQIYDHKKLEDFMTRLLQSNARTIVVVGHNNSAPSLANLLIKQEKYKILDESEYGNLWIIKIKKNKATDEVIQY